MAAQAKVIIKAEDNISRAVNSAKNSLSSLEGAALKMGSMLKNALGFTAVAASVKKLGDVVYGCFADFEEADRKYRQLEIALGGGEAFDKVSGTISELSRQTLESKDSIETMVAELAALGKSSDEIDRISRAAVYLSNVTGRDLNSSMTTLMNTYSGTTTQLKRLGIDVSDLTGAELRNGAAVDRVIESLQVYSEELARTDTRQHLTNISNAWGDIKQSVGDLVNFSFAPMVASFDDVVTGMQRRFDSWIQDVKIVLANFPEFFSKLSETVKSMFSKLISYDNIKGVVTGIVDALPKMFESMLKRISLILELFLGTIPDAVKGLMDGIGNYVMYIVTNICDDIGFDLSGLINSIGKWLTDSSIGSFIDTVISTTVNGIRFIGTLIGNIPDMVSLVADNADVIVRNTWTSLKNWFWGSLSDLFTGVGQWLETLNLAQRIEDVRTDLANVFGRMGAWFTSIGETAKDTFRYIGDVIMTTFSWDSLKTMVTVLFKNIGTIAATAIKEIFVNIPDMVSGIFDGVITWIGYLGVKLKNTLVESVQNFIRDAGSKLEGTWVDKLFGLGKALSGVDFGIDRTGEERLRAESLAAFSSVGDGFGKAVTDAVDAAETIKENNRDIARLYEGIDGIKVSVPEYEDVKAEVKETGRLTEALLALGDKFADRTADNSKEWKDIAGKFSALLSPEIEKWERESGETIGEKLASWTAKSSKEYLEASKKSFSSIGGILKEWGVELSDEVGGELEDLWGKVGTYVGDLFGDDLSEFSSWLEGFLADHREEITGAVDDAADSIAKAIGKSTVSGDILKGAWSAATASGVKDEEGNALSIFSKDSGIANITSSLASSFSALFSALGPVIDAVSSGAWWMMVLAEILEGFVNVIVPAINTVLQPLKDALQGIGAMLAGLFLPILDSLYPIIQIIGALITNLVAPAFQMLSPIVELVALVLDALAPVIAFVGKVFTAIMAPVQYVADLFSWLGKWISYLGSCIGVAVYNMTHPLKTKSMPSTPGSFSSDAFTGLEDRLAAWDTYAAGTGTAVTDSVSTGTAISSAGYQGATQVTINIYQQSPIVGDGGMRQFAQMIRREFEGLDYYGVTT